MMCARREVGAQRPAPSTSAGVPRRADTRTGRARARLFRFPPALALLLGALSLFGAAPAAAQCMATDVAITGTPVAASKRALLVPDCTALLAAKTTLEGTGGTALNWARTLKMNSWTGVTLNNGLARVQWLHLNSKGLKGTIPSGLSALTRLKHLYLHQNELTGTIPDLSALSFLTLFYAYENKLTGGIPALPTSLTTLQLHKNELSGTIPATLNDLTKLTGLYLHDNQFTGSVPDLSNTKLTGLSVSRNQLGGTVGALPATLVSLEMTDNDLTGSLPDLSAMTSFRKLHAERNRFTGGFPVLNSTLQLGVRLNDNRLTGESRT